MRTDPCLSCGQGPRAGNLTFPDPSKSRVHNDRVTPAKAGVHLTVGIGATQSCLRLCYGRLLCFLGILIQNAIGQVGKVL